MGQPERKLFGFTLAKTSATVLRVEPQPGQNVEQRGSFSADRKV
jgi:hypothetical protein